MNEYIVTFGKFDSILVKAANAKQAVSVAKIMDRELANLCASQRAAIKAIRAA